MLAPEHTVPSSPVNRMMKQFKETIHPKMEIHSSSAQPHADGKTGEVSESTKHFFFRRVPGFLEALRLQLDLKRRYLHPRRTFASDEVCTNATVKISGGITT